MPSLILFLLTLFASHCLPVFIVHLRLPRFNPDVNQDVRLPLSTSRFQAPSLSVIELNGILCDALPDCNTNICHKT